MFISYLAALNEPGFQKFLLSVENGERLPALFKRHTIRNLKICGMSSCMKLARRVNNRINSDWQFHCSSLPAGYRRVSCTGVIMKIFPRLFIVALICLTSCAGNNKIANKDPNALTEGLVYGSGHSFWISAPNGWILDNSSGVNKGLHAVFYPKGSTWENSIAVMYVNTAERKPDESLDDFIKGDTENFKKKGSPNIKIQNAEPIKTKDGKIARVRLFTGDQWENSEGVAYIQENKVIVVIVLTSRTAADFQKSLSSFQELVKSYQFFTEDVRVEK